MPTFSTVNLDCLLSEKPKNGVKRGKPRWLKMQSHQLSCPNVSCINVNVEENDNCLKRVYSFDNIDIVQEHANYHENLKQQFISHEQLEHQNLTGTRRKTKFSGCTSKDSIIKRSKENRRCHSFNHKHLTFKAISKEHETPDEESISTSWIRPELIFDAASIVKQEKLGCGEFGVVTKGLYKHRNAVFKVAIKSARQNFLTNEIDQESIRDLLDEAKSMASIDEYHDNIVNLHGIMINEPEKVSLILEYCSNGDLRTFLIKNNKELAAAILANDHEPNIKFDSNCFKMDIFLLIVWSYQVALGMSFLSLKKIYHGDLAARNILLTDNFVPKISDFGFSKRLYLNASKCLYKDLAQDNSLELPLRWSAIETLMYGLVSSKADVWSYGVLLWEIFQLGEIPYRPGLTFDKLKRELMSGIRLEGPDYAPRAIKTLCKNCWNADPEKRPDFGDILSFIKHNFKIKTQDDACDSGQCNNMYSITYAKLQFHETSIKDQFETILQSINVSSPQRTAEGNEDDNTSDKPSSDGGFSLSGAKNKKISYKTVDPVRSQALMACQLELEMENYFDGPMPNEDMKANEALPSTSIPVYSSVNQLNDTPTPPWYRRQRQIINSRTIIILVLSVVIFLIIVHIVYFIFT